MEYLTQNNYTSPASQPRFLFRKFPSIGFYTKMLPRLWRASRFAKKGEYPRERWVHDTLLVVRELESVGVRFEVENVEAFRNLEGPCVFVSNHMSTLETFIFPCIIAPFRETTFVIKRSLIRYPVFKHIMLNCDPIIVGRSDARADFQIVMREGQDRIARNISVVVFPQSTRSVNFIPTEFNSMGVKLARSAKVPVVPIALKTNAWRNNGMPIKDFGTIDPQKPVHIKFGEPLFSPESGKKDHENIIKFITDSLESWR